MTIVISSNGKVKFYNALYDSSDSYATVSKSDVDIKQDGNIISGAVPDLTVVDLGRNTSINVSSSSYTITQNGAYNIIYSYQDSTYIQTIAFTEDQLPGPSYKLPFTLNAAVLIDDTTIDYPYTVFGFVGTDQSSSLRLATTLKEQGGNYWIQPGLISMNGQDNAVLDRIEFYKENTKVAKYDESIDLVPGPGGMAIFPPILTPPPGTNGFMKAYSNALPILLINNETSISVNVEMGTTDYTYIEPSKSATDNEDGDLTDQITSIIIDKNGDSISDLQSSIASANHNDYFTVRYSVADSAGASINADYVINIIDSTSPDAPQLVEPETFVSKYNKNNLPEKIVNLLDLTIVVHLV